jgi:hypothetical protein
MRSMGEDETVALAMIISSEVTALTSLFIMGLLGVPYLCAASFRHQDISISGL